MKKIILIFLVCLLVVLEFTYRQTIPIIKRYPRPTGNYAIGTTALELKDPFRRELYSKTSSDTRNLMIRLWYPKHRSSLNSIYFSFGDELLPIASQFSYKYGFPQWLSVLMLSNIKTHADVNASVSKDKKSYPVILFSHGLFGSTRDLYVSIIEDLVSHGFIVVAIGHPYFEMATVYPDGRVVTDQELSAQFEKMTPQEEQPLFLTEAIGVYKADIRFVLDQLELLNKNPKSIFYTRLDLHRIGIVGHSAGGTAAIETCRVDSRCKAAINLDGWYDHVIGWEPLKVPLLMLFAGAEPTEISEPTAEYLKRKHLTREQYFDRERTIAQHKRQLCSAVSGCEMRYLPGTGHGDSGDWNLMKWPLRSWNAPNPYEIHRKINDYILAFLSKHLEWDLQPDED